jgi:WD40 repeat protein
MSQDYNEAIQNAATCLADFELRSGRLVTNPLGLPLPRSGAFADVYEIDCPNTGKRWAVKCFTREVPGLQERYSAIGKHLAASRLSFMVDFQYLAAGIRVRGQWYPILKMQWVDGLLLNDFVHRYCNRPATLDKLSELWRRMAARLREAGIAHGDLQHGNVMLVASEKDNALKLKLIDYDGMYVRALSGRPSGEVGHPAFQHPERLRTGAYDAEVDRVSLLLVATALRALVVGGRALWERYDNGDNLLFRAADLATPASSELFQQLRKSPDERCRRLAEALYRACTGPLASAPRLESVLEAPAGISASQADTTRPSRFRYSPLAAGVVTGLLLLCAGFGFWWSQQQRSAPPAPMVAQGEAPPPRADQSNSGVATPDSAPRNDASATPSILPQSPSPASAPRPTTVGANSDAGKIDAKASSTVEAAPISAATAAPNQAGDKQVKPDGARATEPPAAAQPAKTETAPSPAAPPKLADSQKEKKADTRPTLAPAAPAPTEGSLAKSTPQPTSTPKASPPPKNNDSIDGRGLLVGEVARVKAHAGQVRRLALSPDGRRLLSAGWDKSIWVWDLDGPQATRFRQALGLRFRPAGSLAANAVAFLPDGRHALAGGDHGNLILWDVDAEGEKQTFQGHKENIHHVAVSPDGKTGLSCGPESSVFVWNLDTGSERRQLSGHEGGVECVAFSHDGRLAVAGTMAGPIVVWDAATGRELGRLTGHDRNVMGMVFSADNRQLFSCGIDMTIRSWNVELGQELSRLLGGSAGVHAIALAPDGSRILAASADGHVRGVDFRMPGVLCCDFVQQQNVWDVAIGRDGQYAYSAGASTDLHVWRLPPTAPGKILLNRVETVTEKDSLDSRRPGRRCKIETGTFEAGKTYIVELTCGVGSASIDPILRIEDRNGTKVLAEDNDSGGYLNARIAFTAPTTDVYRVVVANQVPNQPGRFFLLVTEALTPAQNP